VRHVPLTPELEAELKASRHLKSQLVFCRPDGKPLTLRQLHNVLETACRRSGLREIRWHDLRNSFASQLTMRGLPIRRVQEWLGHSSIQMHALLASRSERRRRSDRDAPAEYFPPTRFPVSTEPRRNFWRGNVVATVVWGADLGPDIRAIR